VTYIGRFAPSPTGPLHIGSLATAVASYLHARQAGGHWLVRMENIDPPREVAGAADDILRTLEAYELYWDGTVLYQSTRRERYEEITGELLQLGAAFRCSCTRRELRARGPLLHLGTPGGDIDASAGAFLKEDGGACDDSCCSRSRCPGRSESA
jgi:glutamyl-Q tRNA(Asp) synthetase